MSVGIEGKAPHKAEVNARADASVASKSSVSRGLTMPVVSFFGIRVKKFFGFLSFFVASHATQRVHNLTQCNSMKLFESRLNNKNSETKSVFACQRLICVLHLHMSSFILFTDDKNKIVVFFGFPKKKSSNNGPV